MILFPPQHRQQVHQAVAERGDGVAGARLRLDTVRQAVDARLQAGDGGTGIGDQVGLDGLHAVSFAGVAPVQTWLPDFSTAGAVKKGEVEMNAAIVLKATKAAGVFRKIKVV